MNAFIHRHTLLAVATLLASAASASASPTATPSQHPRPWRTPPWPPNHRTEATQPVPTAPGSEKLETATFGSGCFWCTEAVFQQPPRREVRRLRLQRRQRREPDVRRRLHRQHRPRRSDPGHVRPGRISFDDLLKVFWQTHDPTTPNQQGHDVGTQYRSAVFYHTDDQRRIAEQYKQQLDASKTFATPIVTEITPFKNFYPAEKYHQNYFNSNPSQSYCQFVIRPKVEKFNKEFKELLKEK